MLDLRRLTTFREVVGRRSFSAAAQALDYTQSSVSQQITTLERELGVALLDRATRPVAPTALGEALMARAESLLNHATSIERELGALARGDAGVLRVGGFFTAWTTFMPAAIATFSRAHPNVSLELHQMEPEPAERALGAGELDVAVVYLLSDPDDDARLRTRLLDDPYAIALPREHPLAAREHVAFAELADEHWVSPPPHEPYAQVLVQLCREHGGFTPRVTYETADIAMAQPIVAAGLAVAMLPALGLVPAHAGVAVRPLDSAPPARSVWAVRPALRAPTADAMADALAQAARRR